MGERVGGQKTLLSLLPKARVLVVQNERNVASSLAQTAYQTNACSQAGDSRSCQTEPRCFLLANAHHSTTSPTPARCRMNRRQPRG